MSSRKRDAKTTMKTILPKYQVEVVASNDGDLDAVSFGTRTWIVHAVAGRGCDARTRGGTAKKVGQHVATCEVVIGFACDATAERSIDFLLLLAPEACDAGTRTSC
jgi:hypothetical protein